MNKIKQLKKSLTTRKVSQQSANDTSQDDLDLNLNEINQRAIQRVIQQSQQSESSLYNIQRLQQLQPAPTTIQQSSSKVVDSSEEQTNKQRIQEEELNIIEQVQQNNKVRSFMNHSQFVSEELKRSFSSKNQRQEVQKQIENLTSQVYNQTDNQTEFTTETQSVAYREFQSELEQLQQSQKDLERRKKEIMSNKGKTARSLYEEQFQFNSNSKSKGKTTGKDQNGGTGEKPVQKPIQYTRNIEPLTTKGETTRIPVLVPVTKPTPTPTPIEQQQRELFPTLTQKLETIQKTKSANKEQNLTASQKEQNKELIQTVMDTIDGFTTHLVSSNYARSNTHYKKYYDAFETARNSIAEEIKMIEKEIEQISVV